MINIFKQEINNNQADSGLNMQSPSQQKPDRQSPQLTLAVFH